MKLDEPITGTYVDLYDAVVAAVKTTSKAFREKAALYTMEDGKEKELYDSYFFYHWVNTFPSDPEKKRRFKEDLANIRLSDTLWRQTPGRGVGNQDAAKAAFELSARYNLTTIQKHLAGYLQFAESEGADLFALRDLKLKDKAKVLLAETLAAPLAGPPKDHKEPSKPDNDLLSKKYQHELAKSYGYVRSTIFANAVRLIGASGETFTTRDIVVTTTLDRFIKPPQMLPIWGDVLGHVKTSAMEKGIPFHNSLHTRLVDYNIHIIPHTERKQLHLTLGPIYWEEYSVLRWLTDRMSVAELNNYVRIDQVAETGKISDSKLHNILGTVTTLLTADGYLLYSRRGKRVSVAENSFTSCIAENISTEKDSSLDAEKNALLPSPFRAAARGALEEMSKGISDYLLANEECNLICLGLSFDLGSYHPDVILFGVLPITFAQVQKIRREDPGEDFFEGHVLGLHLANIQGGEYGDLTLPDWTGSGKASFLRAVEFLNYWAKAAHCELADVIPQLKISNSQSA